MTNIKSRIISVLSLLCLFSLLMAVPAFAIDESEVEAAVNASSREEVTGNVLIWFLCAVAFLKVSQKIDSFMSSLGVNVGHTGGSLLGEAMIAAKGISVAARAAGKAVGGFSRGTSGPKGADGASGTAGAGGFFRHGLVGMAVRKASSDAVKTATSTTQRVSSSVRNTSHTSSVVRPDAGSASAVHNTATHTATVEQTVGTIHTAEASHTAASARSEQTVHSNVAQQQTTVERTAGAGTIHTAESTHTVESAHTATASRSEQASHSGHTTDRTHQQAAATHSHSSSTLHQTSRHTSIVGRIFTNSMLSGGKFANDVIGKVATGDIRSTGSISGDFAAQALACYTGLTAQGDAAPRISYSDVEIGGGRITGTEYTPEHPEGISFGLYHVEQYIKPEGDFQKVYTADGAQWYKQYAVDTVVKTPYRAPDGEVDYHRDIVKRLPDPPKRKDRL